MKCPVCGKKSQHIQCPDCGFDSSRDYEKYPTLAPVGKAPAISSLQKQWEQLEKTDKVIRKKRPWLALIACAAMLVIGIAIGIGFGGEKVPSTEPSESVQIQVPPETTVPITYEPGKEPWRENVLKSDVVNIRLGTAKECPVFGSEYRRGQIHTVTFLDSLEEAPEDAWDVSDAGDGKVLAWVIPNGGLYDLYIGAEGGISAGKASNALFAGYSCMNQIHNLDFLHTENVQTMNDMFFECSSLTSLDLSSFDTSNVKGMSSMFANCTSLTSLDLSSFDTSNVRWMRFMFVECSSLISLDLNNFDTSNVQAMNQMFDGCSSLTSLDLSSFDTSNVQDMSWMFSRCGSLTSLDLSSFDTSNVRDMSGMFSSCGSLTSLDLSSFDTSIVRDMIWMFSNCPAGVDWQHLLK